MLIVIVKPLKREFERLLSVTTSHPECSIVFLLQEKEAECLHRMSLIQRPSLLMVNNTAGCSIEWDGVNCWPAATIGEEVSVSCPQPLKNHAALPAPITRNCTIHGWSLPSLPYYKACLIEDNGEDTGDKQKYFAAVKLIYTIGYGMSLASLISAIVVFCTFRKLLCTRTYIHLNLFSSFILRGVAVFVKDAVLFADESTDHCTVSTAGCKAAVALFQYCVMANFFWLLVEGLYLHTLLVFTFTQERRIFWWYTLIGWGSPTLTIVIWALFKSQYDNKGCWDDLDSALWWIIKTPILFSVFVNFLVFVNIIRIIFQKMKMPDVEGSERPHYSRLAKSTLLLIPLFGVHYTVFALFPEHVGLEPRLCFELVLGSFQGFIVALLYCFLNGEVQNEVLKQMRRCHLHSGDTREGNAFDLVTQDYTA
ncbi:growth hormone releasing hormone receptor 2 [Megalops cyprinoides]|uniref:growth hormone releasing hormone receptor 2 n=1 Tax=Megalops cyprinoides TaxID=118141 RepID=UPI0018646A6C|nr:growth hormone releasing hormone receptor 2 [Megalops cyprinoides]